MQPGLILLALLLLTASCSKASEGRTGNPNRMSAAREEKPAQAAPQIFGCPEPNTATSRFLPLEAGPLILTKVLCRSFHQEEEKDASPGLLVPEVPALLSPDGTKLLAFDIDGGGMSLSTVATTPRVWEIDAKIVTSLGEAQQVAWASDSRFAWAVRQQTVVPNGFAITPLKPFRVSRDGTIRELPVLTHSAGTLDELSWAGRRGMALARFGTKGSFYRPERPDPHPTLAIVDASQGKVVQSFPMSALPGIAATDVAAVTTADAAGRVRAMLTYGDDHWVYWEQGQLPREVPMGIPIGRGNYTLSPDGRRVLVMRDLSASGVQCEYYGRPTHCPAPTPQSGPIAQLRDLGSGRVIWSLNGMASNFSSDLAPVISDNGRYALITTPDGAPGGAYALISMTNGNVLQRIERRQNTYDCTFGFRANDTIVWMNCFTTFAEYRLRSARF